VKLELFEIEDRPVAVDVSGSSGRAWAWSAGSWREAPGLVLKSALEGEALDPVSFSKRFPDADLAAISSKGELVSASG